MVPIEIISYFVRPVSLSGALSRTCSPATSSSKLFAGLLISLGALFSCSGCPVRGRRGVHGVEIFIALLQAYVFTILTCLYLNDALNMAH